MISKIYCSFVERVSQKNWNNLSLQRCQSYLKMRSLSWEYILTFGIIRLLIVVFFIRFQYNFQSGGIQKNDLFTKFFGMHLTQTIYNGILNKKLKYLNLQSGPCLIPSRSSISFGANYKIFNLGAKISEVSLQFWWQIPRYNTAEVHGFEIHGIPFNIFMFSVDYGPKLFFCFWARNCQARPCLQ